MAQLVVGDLLGLQAVAEEGTSEGVRRALVANIQHLLELVVVVDVDGDDGSEDLFHHALVVRHLGEDDGRLHKVTDALVAVAAEDDLSVLAGFGAVDVALAVVERSLVDDGVHVVGEVFHITHLDGAHHVAHAVLHVVPHRSRDVGTRGSGALLALVFEGATHDGHGYLLRVGAVVDEDEVFAAGLTHETRIGLVHVEVLAGGLPQALEGGGAAGEVDGVEVLVLQGHAADHAALARQEVDDASGKAGFHEDAHVGVVRQQGSRRGLPDGGVTHQGGGHVQIGGDGGEVERRDGEHEAFQRAVFGTVQLVVGRSGLLGVELAGVVVVVAEKVDGLAGAVDLGLETVLRLAEHGGGVDAGAVLGGQHLGDACHDGGALVPRRVLPVVLGGLGGVDGHADFLFAYRLPGR